RLGTAGRGGRQSSQRTRACLAARARRRKGTAPAFAAVTGIVTGHGDHVLNNATARPFVIVPCLNEALAIRGLLEGVLVHCHDVIVIDDGSTDDTAAI